MYLAQFASFRLLFVIVLAINTSAQNHVKESTVKTEPTSRPKASKTSSNPKQFKLTPQQQHALRLLATARAEAAGLEPEMRAFVLWKVARGLESVDSEKSMSILKDAFRASQSVEEKQVDSENCGMDEVCHVKRFLQQGILLDIAFRAPEQAETLLPQAEAEVREEITSTLIDQYTRNKDLARAEDLLLRESDAKRYPYNAACELLSKLSVSSPERLTIFLQAVNNFRQQRSDDLVSLTDDLGEMVARFWQTLPPPAVLDAIDVLLDSAKERDQHNVMHVGVSAKGGKSASFDSAYQVRLFQVLPVLEQLDKSRAEDLLKENTNMRSMLKQYPQGMQSLNLNGSGSGKDSGIYSTEYSMDSDSAQEAARQARTQQRTEIKRRLDRISEEVSKDPKQALSDAMALPVKGPGEMSLSPRVLALTKVARATKQKYPEVATSALDETRKNVDDLTLFQRGQVLAEVADLYVQMGRPDEARKTLQEAMKAAEKLYAKDVDASDPNLAFKGVWPSSGLWWKCVQTAAAISPQLPEELIGEIRDAEIASVQRVAYANSLLGRRETPEMAEQHKDGMASIVSF